MLPPIVQRERVAPAPPLAGSSRLMEQAMREAERAVDRVLGRYPPERRRPSRSSVPASSLPARDW